MSLKPVTVLGIAGSLRKGSFNAALLRAAVELAPADLVIEIGDLSELPFYNGDVEAAGAPDAVKRFKEQIRAADALLVSTPEYNFSVPGIVKNAFDWASRPPAQNVLAGKPAAVMGAGGRIGTSRMQYHFRQCALGWNMHMLNKPEVFVTNAAEKFDASGRLTEESSREVLAQLLAGLRDWTRRLQLGQEALKRLQG